VAAGALGQLGGRQRSAVGHGLVEPELVADDHQRRGRRRAHVLDELAHELLELLLVDGWRRRHESLRPSLTAAGSRRPVNASSRARHSANGGSRRQLAPTSGTL
jgi:hypothetical protein